MDELAHDTLIFIFPFQAGEGYLCFFQDVSEVVPATETSLVSCLVSSWSRSVTGDEECPRW